MLALGFGLNGTSSVLYANVAAFGPRGRRSRTYGYYYTLTESASIAPFIYGRLADLTSLRATMAVMAAATALILPASLALRGHLAAGAGPALASAPASKLRGIAQRHPSLARRSRNRSVRSA